MRKTKEKPKAEVGRGKAGAKADVWRVEEAGFSLTEALVALAILSVLMGAIVTVFYQSQATYRTQLEQAERIQQMRIAMDQIVRALRQAGNDPFKSLDVPPVMRLVGGEVQLRTDITGSVPSVTGYSREATGDPDGEFDSIYETVTFQHDPQAKVVFADVGYGPQILAEGITLLSFVFYDLDGNVVGDPSLASRVKVLMVGESQLPDMQTKKIDTLTLESDVFIRSKMPQIFTE